MPLLKALEKHIPSASLFLEEAQDISSDREKDSSIWHSIDREKTEFLAVYGLSAPFYLFARDWLDEQAHRRLVFIEEKGSALSLLLKDDDAILLLNDLRVKLYFLETPLQLEFLAKKVAWQAVLRKMTVVQLRESRYGRAFQEAVEKNHLAADLLLSENADSGCAVLKNAKVNRKYPARLGLALRGQFTGIPALIVGAGPSLERQLPLFAQWEDRALILAGGSALNVLQTEPHLAASIDKEAPYAQFKSHSFPEVPFCYQGRMSGENCSLFHGERILFPDGSNLALDWLYGMEETFEVGWTVTNFLTAAALFFGCNPIIWVGMDLCYKEGRKYAGLEVPLPEGLLPVIDDRGEKVWTQRDWLMSARWLEALARRHPETRFLNATQGGLKLGAPISSEPFDELLKKQKRLGDLRGRVHAAIQELPFHSIPEERWRDWERSVKRCAEKCREALLPLEDLETEIVYQKWLLPLWQVWSPIFEREAEMDLEPLSLAEKMRIHQILFFQQVLEEYEQILQF